MSSSLTVHEGQPIPSPELLRRAAATGRAQVVAIGVVQEYRRVLTGRKSQTNTDAVCFSYDRQQRLVTCY